MAGLLLYLLDQRDWEDIGASAGCRGAALRIEDVAAIVLGLLPALDAVPFQLSIDPAGPGTLTAAPVAAAAAPPASAATAPLAAAGQSAAGALPTQTADCQAAAPDGKGADAHLAEPSHRRHSADQQAAVAAPAPGKAPMPPPVAATGPVAATSQPNGGFLASFGGLLGRRGGHAAALQSPITTAASPSKGSRWGVEPPKFNSCNMPASAESHCWATTLQPACSRSTSGSWRLLLRKCVPLMLQACRGHCRQQRHISRQPHCTPSRRPQRLCHARRQQPAAVTSVVG